MHEIVEYCRLYDVQLKDEETKFLQSYTEGWISAVYLYILGYRQAGCFERQSATLNELIEKIVYQPCTEEMKIFLTMISIFDSFSLEQAEYMWVKGNARVLLEQLIDENSFVSFDYAERSYHLHNILTGYLRQIFAQYNLNLHHSLWRRAGRWYLDAGDYNTAMNCFFQAADFESLLTTIELGKGAVLHNAYRKLGVSNRVALTRMITEQQMK